MQIIIENHDPSDSRSLLRVIVDGRPAASNLTAAQAHLLVGDIFEQTLGPKRRPDQSAQSGMPLMPPRGG
jgi:hypothetical protein